MCAAEPGYVFLHIIGPGTDKLELLLNDINEHYKSKVMTLIRTVDTIVLYMYITLLFT